MGQQQACCSCKPSDCGTWVPEVLDARVATVHVGPKMDTVEQAFCGAVPMGQIPQEFENGMSEHQGGEVGEIKFVPQVSSGIRSSTETEKKRDRESQQRKNSRKTSLRVPSLPTDVSQGSIGEHESCKSSEPPTPSAVLQKSESDNDKRKHVKAVVQEFRSEAQSGITCKIYQLESDASVTNKQPRFNTMSLKAEVIRFCSEPMISSELDIHEVPLSYINVFDYQEFKKQRSDLDNDTKEALQHEDPNALPSSVFLVSTEKTLCIVLQDQNMMRKCRLTLQVLSNYFRNKALKDTMTGSYVMDTMTGA